MQREPLLSTCNTALFDSIERLLAFFYTQSVPKKMALGERVRHTLILLDCMPDDLLYLRQVAKPETLAQLNSKHDNGTLKYPILASFLDSFDRIKCEQAHKQARIPYGYDDYSHDFMLTLSEHWDKPLADRYQRTLLKHRASPKTFTASNAEKLVYLLHCLLGSLDDDTKTGLMSISAYRNLITELLKTHVPVALSYLSESEKRIRPGAELSKQDALKRYYDNLSDANKATTS